MSSLNLLIATMQADGRLPKSPCAKIEKLKKTEKATREKRIKVEKSAKKQRSKAIEKLTAKVKREVHEIDDTYGKPGKPLKCSTPKPTKAATKKRAKRATITTKDSAALQRGIKAEQKEHGHGKKTARQIAADHLAEDPHFYAVKPPAKPAKPAKAIRISEDRKAEKAEAAAKKKAEASAAKENRRQDRANLAAKKKAAKKQAKAGAYRPQVAPESPTRAVRPPKVPRGKKERPVDLPPPQPRREVFVADAAAGDAAKTERAMQGFDDIVARQIARMRAANGPTVESMPRRRAMY